MSIDRLVELTKTTKDGTNFYNISEAASSVGLSTKSYYVTDIEKIKKLNTPFIAQFNNLHFVVVYKISNNNILVMDPATGKVNLDIFDFSNMWTGYIMLFEKVKLLPLQEKNNVLKKIIFMCLFKNINIIVFMIILSIVFTLLSCITSLYSQVVFDKVISTDINNLIVITVFFSILFIIKNITNFIRNYLIIYLNQKLDFSVILSTFSKVILLPYYYYKNKTTSEVLSRINDLGYLKNFISKVIVFIFLDSFTFIISSVIIYSISEKIFFVLLIITFIYMLLVFIFNPFIRKFTGLMQEKKALINNDIIESVSLFETVKGLNIEDNIILKFSKDYSMGLDISYFLEKINNIMLFLKEVITNIGILFVNFLCIKFIMDSRLSIGSYMSITFLSSYLIYPFRNILDILNEYNYIKNTIKRANGLFEIEDEKIYEENKLLVSGNIDIRNLDYTFNNKKYVFNNISFCIRDKEKVLILGKSGSGKSTIMKLLYKYYDVSRDKIFINNYDINDYSMSDIRNNITYVSQNEMLFTGTIRENIILGRNISEEFFLNVCKITCVDEIVKDNILGYDYLLEENGVNISGGQRQRIILARSLLKNSSIFMIDEGLNQIDINLERKILKNIFYSFSDKTFIIVSHRKENMDLYDRVLKIDKDRVLNLERGN